MVNVPMMDFGGVYIPRELGEEVALLIQKNNKVEAIRVLREGAGLDLKTAKDTVDLYCEKS